MRFPPITSAAPPTAEGPSPSHRLRLDLLTTPWFLLGLGVLLLNDFVLKDAFNNWWTGKLSDFAGVPLFALFLTAFLPRHRRAIFIGTAVAFTFWKSPLSQPFIDGWNELGLFHIARVVDYTDLLALLMLPVAYWVAGKQTPNSACGFRPRMALKVGVAGVASFAIVATSYLAPPTQYDTAYEFGLSRDELADMVLALGYVVHSESSGHRMYGPTIPSESVPSAITTSPVSIHVPTTICQGFSDNLIEAVVQVGGEGENSTITLTAIHPHCDTPDPPTPEQFLEVFESLVIDRLREMIASD